ncbi:MAG: LysR substrate-binding domain-containing protein [Castellaniella sp.]|uniref:LysR substrate-binding domain-containing protein n=1 Tax=Castellaniella sp. TaxID=1955812 RepID=UPI003C75D1B8
MNQLIEHESLDEQNIRSRLTVRHLSVLASLGRHRNGHQVAAELNLTQPAISKAVREIEGIFNIKLFDSGRNGTHPNRVGEALINRAAALINQLGDTQREIEAIIQGESGSLRLGVIPFITPDLITQTLKRLHEKKINLTMEIREDTTTSLVNQLLAKELDCAIGRYANVREDELEQQILRYQRFSVVVSSRHPMLGAGKHITLEHTTDFAWIVPPPRTAARTMLSELFVKAGLRPPSVRIETSSLEVIKAALADNDLIAIIPTDIARHYALADQLRILPIDTDYQLAPLTLIRRRNETMLPSTQWFCEQLLAIGHAMDETHDAAPAAT